MFNGYAVMVQKGNAMKHVVENMKVTLDKVSGLLATMPKDVGGKVENVTPWVEYDVPENIADVQAMLADPTIGVSRVCELLAYAIDLKERAKVTGRLKAAYAKTHAWTDAMADQCLKLVQADDALRAEYSAVCATVSWERPTSFGAPKEWLRSTWYAKFA